MHHNEIRAGRVVRPVCRADGAAAYRCSAKLVVALFGEAKGVMVYARRILVDALFASGLWPGILHMMTQPSVTREQKYNKS